MGYRMFILVAYDIADDKRRRKVAKLMEDYGHCACQPSETESFRPIRSWLQRQDTPEMFLIENKWTSLAPAGGVARLLADVLPTRQTFAAISSRTKLLSASSQILPS
jgi:hypothetical protein